MFMWSVSSSVWQCFSKLPVLTVTNLVRIQVLAVSLEALEWCISNKCPGAYGWIWLATLWEVFVAQVLNQLHEPTCWREPAEKRDAWIPSSLFYGSELQLLVRIFYFYFFNSSWLYWLTYFSVQYIPSGDSPPPWMVHKIVIAQLS